MHDVVRRSDAGGASNALGDRRRCPGLVEVDDDRRALQVDPLRQQIGGNDDPHVESGVAIALGARRPEQRDDLRSVNRYGGTALIPAAPWSPMSSM